MGSLPRFDVGDISERQLAPSFMEVKCPVDPRRLWSMGQRTRDVAARSKSFGLV